MSATIIDSLIVRLGLDAKDVKQGTPAATGDLKKIETQAGNTESAIGDLAAKMGAFFALLGGTMALKNFTEDVINSTAALQRLSRNLGLDIGTLNAWGNAAELAGGSATGLQGTLDMLSKAQTQFKVTGESSLIPYFSALGLSFSQFALKGQPVTDALLDIQVASERMISDRTTRYNFLRQMGIDEGTANMLMQTRKELETTIARQKDFNVASKRFGEDAVKIQQQMIGLKQQAKGLALAFVGEAAPGIQKLLDVLSDLGTWINNNREFIADFGKILGVIAIGFAAISAASSPLTLTVAAVVALAGAVALLWQDYQTWKRGGDSLIDWERWRPAIEAATKAINILKESLQGLTDAYKSYYEKASGHKFSVKNFIDDTKFALGMDNVYTPENKPKAHQAGTKDKMLQYYQDRGWTKEQAAGIVANLMSESSGKTDAVGDSGKAYGIGQWHSDRQQAFKDFAGKDIRESDLIEQMAFVQHELTQGMFKSAGDKLRKANDAGDAGSIISRYYERPRDVDGEAARRAASAQAMVGIPDAASATAGASPQSFIERSTNVDIEHLEIHTQATDAAGIAQEIGPAIQDHLFTSQGNSGLR